MTPANPMTSPVPASAKPTADKKKDAHHRDPVREAIETIVFVVTLVLLLKLFVVEAFVIPTGSMAETLYGYQKIVDCPQCGFKFPVNSKDEVEPEKDGARKMLLGFTCPNCRFHGEFKDVLPEVAGDIESPSNRTGDRVLVLKPLYHVTDPHRGDVVVFKYPQAPQENQTAANYIKRAKAFGGETVGIYRGELFATRALTYPEDLKDENGEPVYPRPNDPKDLWKPRYTYNTASSTSNNPLATELFEKSLKAGFPAGADGFEIVRKPDDQVLASKRIVWDNDHQPQDLKGRFPNRWSGGPGWTADNNDESKVFTHAGGELGWLRYQHLVVTDRRMDPKELKPSVIRNFLGYNAGEEVNPQQRPARPESVASRADEAWVGDLLLECEAQFQSADAEVVLELSKGVHRYQAKFAGGNATLVRTGGEAKELVTRPSGIKAPGKYKLMFANVDCRLRVWVDGKAIDFGTDADYSPVEAAVENGGTEGYTDANDRDAPASIGAQGGAVVSHLVLSRDIYYTRQNTNLDFEPGRAEIYYVQPGHYLCLGDNSSRSSDSRTWGTVPERLMLGKAVFVFWPVWPPPNRMGFIK